MLIQNHVRPHAVDVFTEKSLPSKGIRMPLLKVVRHFKGFCRRSSLTEILNASVKATLALLLIISKQFF